ADNRPVVFCTATNSLIDYLHKNETEADAFKRLASYGTALTILTADAAMERYENTFKTEPKEITEAKFMEMLCILPPSDWRNDGTAESFKMCERQAGFVTAIYVHLEKRFFEFYDDIRTPHAECCKRVRQSPAYALPRKSDEPDAERQP
ncbi:MAG: hypothetical protein ABL893_19305, partial [Hyphomicrobium sp.]